MSSERIFGLIRRVLRRAINTDTPNVQVQVESSADEPHSDVEVLETYGLTTHPPESVPEGIALFLNGQSDHGIVIGWLDRAHRPAGLKAGEVQLYSVHGQNALFDKDGQVTIDATQHGQRIFFDKEGQVTLEATQHGQRIFFDKDGQVTLEATQHGQRLVFNKDGEVEIVAKQGQKVLLDKTGQIVMTDKAGSKLEMLASGSIVASPANTLFHINGYLTASYGGSSIGMGADGDITLKAASGVVKTIGDAHATGDMVSDVEGRAVSAMGHEHTGVVRGGDRSEGPV